MADQEKFVDVEQGAILWGAGDDWRNADEPETRSYRVESVRPKTLIVSGAIGSAWQGDSRRYDRVLDVPGNVASGAVARTPYGWLYRTEQDAVRALIRKTEIAVERSELRAQNDRELLAGARELLKKLGGGAAALVAVALVALAAPQPASAALGFTQRVEKPALSGRTVTMTGTLVRTTAPRSRSVRVSFSLYRAPRGRVQGTLIRTITRTLRPGQQRVDVRFSERRTATSRAWVWFGFIDYTVVLPGRDRRFTGTGESAWLRVR